MVVAVLFFAVLLFVDYSSPLWSWFFSCLFTSSSDFVVFGRAISALDLTGWNFFLWVFEAWLDDRQCGHVPVPARATVSNPLGDAFEAWIVTLMRFLMAHTEKPHANGAFHSAGDVVTAGRSFPRPADWPNFSS